MSYSECLATLQGHTSLVSQLQMRDNILVTGGSDGSVRVWSLETMAAIHRLAAHDNSVTTLQFDKTRIVSGGSDGRVKIWDVKTGYLIRELSSQFQAVWRVAFEAEKCIILAQKQNRTVMEVSETTVNKHITDFDIKILTVYYRSGPLQRRLRMQSGTTKALIHTTCPSRARPRDHKALLLPITCLRQW